MHVPMLQGSVLAVMAQRWQRGSQKTLVIDAKALPILPDVEEYASMGLIPGGAYRNREFAAKFGYISTAELWREDLVFDPQTSGGLLAAVPAEEAEKLLAELKELNLLPVQ